MLPRLSVILLLALPAGAQEASVTLPAIPPLPAGEAGHLLQVLVMANVAAWNCSDVADGTAPRLLLAGSLDLLVQQAGLDESGLGRVQAPMLAALEKLGFCAAMGPQVGMVLDMLVFWGGSLALNRG